MTAIGSDPFRLRYWDSILMYPEYETHRQKHSPEQPQVSFSIYFMTVNCIIQSFYVYLDDFIQMRAGEEKFRQDIPWDDTILDFEIRVT